MVSSMALAQVRYEYESPEKADAPQAKVMKQNGLKPGVRVQTSGKASLLPPPTGTADDIIYEPEGTEIQQPHALGFKLRELHGATTALRDRRLYQRLRYRR